MGEKSSPPLLGRDLGCVLPRTEHSSFHQHLAKCLFYRALEVPLIEVEAVRATLQDAEMGYQPGTFGQQAMQNQDKSLEHRVPQFETEGFIWGPTKKKSCATSCLHR